MTRDALRAPRTMTVRSPAFAEGAPIPRRHSGYAEDTSPPLEWSGAPADAKALAIIIDDPDAPVGTWTHWTVWDLPPGTTRLDEAADVTRLGARQGVTSDGTKGYHGPLPPSGTHRYFFRVFALSRPLGLGDGASIDDVWRAVGERALAWGEIMGTFTHEPPKQR